MKKWAFFCWSGAALMVVLNVHSENSELFLEGGIFGAIFFVLVLGAIAAWFQSGMTPSRLLHPSYRKSFLLCSFLVNAAVPVLTAIGLWVS